ncbi:hypothetical protein CMO93_02200 [Candidatus Woesearchaeota archaeon]|nr:hypothetical protein [Candidatus Woesearchaeota archaeon]|tara:strand:+ start:509 stop:2959 length:2451 start_codon:yes stop_codon:yes gene_type:complete
MRVKKRLLLLLSSIFLILLSATVNASCNNNGICAGAEDCQNCPNDCPTPQGACCDPVFFPFHSGWEDIGDINTVGVITHGNTYGESSDTYRVCCQSTLYPGNCCPDNLKQYCAEGATCVDYKCALVSEEPTTPSEPSTYCGDGNCDSGESCSSCSSDCGSCTVTEPTPAQKKANGESCNSDDECLSDRCRNPQTNNQINGICSNKWAYGSCRTTSDCEDESMMICDDFTCMLRNGNGCRRDAGCLSGNCVNNVCCQEGKTCCARIGDCGAGYVCDYSLMYCVKEDTISSTIVERPSVIEVIEKPSEKVTKKSNGEVCYSNNECESKNCNKAGITNRLESLEGGNCCPVGKNCCNKIGGITGSSRGNELCNDDYYLVPIKKEIEACPSGTCDLVESCKTEDRWLKYEDDDCSAISDSYRQSCEREQAVIKKKCIEQGEHGKITTTDKWKSEPSCTYICCDGVIKDFGEAQFAPNCCSDTDCEENMKCEKNYCVEGKRTTKKAEKTLFKQLQESGINIQVPGNLYGTNVPGISKEDFSRLKRTSGGVLSRELIKSIKQSESWEEVSKLALFKSREAFRNARVFGYYQSMYDVLNVAYVGAKFVSTLQQLPTQLNKLGSISNINDVVENAGTIIEFTDSMASLYGDIYELNQINAKKSGTTKEDSKIMEFIGDVSFTGEIVSSGGWSLLPEISNEIMKGVEESSNYEIELASINLAVAYHTGRLHYISEKASPSDKEITEFFFHAERYIALKRLEAVLKYRDDVAIWKDNPSLAVWLADFIGYVESDKVISDKLKEYDNIDKTFLTMKLKLMKIYRFGG